MEFIYLSTYPCVERTLVLDVRWAAGGPGGVEGDMPSSPSSRRCRHTVGGEPCWVDTTAAPPRRAKPAVEGECRAKPGRPPTLSLRPRPGSAGTAQSREHAHAQPCARAAERMWRQRRRIHERVGRRCSEPLARHAQSSAHRTHGPAAPAPPNETASLLIAARTKCTAQRQRRRIC